MLANSMRRTFKEKDVYNCDGGLPMDTMTDCENPFVLGRTLFVLVVIELISSFGIYVYYW